MTTPAIESAMLLQMSKKKTNHALHITLSVLTFGIWLYFYAFCAIVTWVQNDKIAHEITGEPRSKFIAFFKVLYCITTLATIILIVIGMLSAGGQI